MPSSRFGTWRRRAFNSDAMATAAEHAPTKRPAQVVEARVSRSPGRAAARAVSPLLPSRLVGALPRTVGRRLAPAVLGRYSRPPAVRPARRQAARLASIHARKSSETNRSGPSAPPSRTDGLRPSFAASYSHVRETPSRAATSLGRRSAGSASGSSVCWSTSVMSSPCRISRMVRRVLLRPPAPSVPMIRPRRRQNIVRTSAWRAGSRFGRVG
jgi:hypothetical protein